MKKVIITSLIVVMVLSLGVAFAGKGNEAPSGPHFNLNLIGVKDGKVKDIDNCGDGHRIFVNLGATNNKEETKIKLTEAPDGVTFAVIDCDGTDDGEATFMLPNPDPGKARTTAYSVWVRPLGSPKGKPSATIQTCATECFEWLGDVCVDKGDLICSTEVVTVTRDKGKMSFKDVSRELLTMCVWVWDGTEWNMERVYLFDDDYVDYFWKYGNNGVKLLQMRFYYEEMEYSESDWKCRDMGGQDPPPDPE